jgi:hypothetical protein
MVMIGKVVLSRFVKTDSLALDLDLVVVEAVSVHVVGLEEVSALVEVLAVEADSEEVLAELVVAMVEALVVTEVELVLMQVPQLQPLFLTPSLTMLLLALREVRSSMFATFLGPLATRILSNSSPPSEKSSKPRFSTNRMAAPAVPELYDSILPKMPRPLSRSFLATSTEAVLLD